MASVVESIIEKSFRDGGRIYSSPTFNGLGQNGFSDEFISAQRERVIAHDVVTIFREAIQHTGPSRDPEDVLRYLREHEHMSLDRIQSDPLVSWGVDEMHQEFIQQRFLSIRRLADEIQRGGYSVKQLREMDAEGLVDELVSETASPQDAEDIIERSHLDRGTSHIVEQAKDRALDQRYREEHVDQYRSHAARDGVALDGREDASVRATPPSSDSPKNAVGIQDHYEMASPSPNQDYFSAKKEKKNQVEISAYAVAPVLVMTMGGVGWGETRC